MKILLIDNYDSFTYNLYHYLSSLNVKLISIETIKLKSVKLKEINIKK